MSAETTAKTHQANRLRPLPPDSVLFGCSMAMAEVRHRAEKICRENIPVLLCGEGGTGKEALARWIHANSSYCNGEFAKVSCAAIPGGLLESELFGYQKGGFTGATTSKPGRIELAHKGTLFLEEIADVDVNLQSKLLNFLQDGCFARIGDQSERTIDTRVICATNKDLEHEINSGNFRADLFYRINIIRFRLPPLRERREDIPLLAKFFREHHENQFAMKSEPFSLKLLDYLQNLDWPGNIRELSNGIARYVLIGPKAAFAKELPRKRSTMTRTSSGGEGAAPLKLPTKEAVKDMERNVILEALKANKWNRRKTAQALRISYRTLCYKLHDASLTHRRT